MAVNTTPQKDQAIDGISLSSFLQVLEHERKSCTLVVNQGENTGYLFFSDGNMIDAEDADTYGLDAAYSILSWEKPTFYLAKPEDRMARISQPLTQIIITASTQLDEQKADSEKESKKLATNSQHATKINPLLEKLIKQIKAIPGVKHYYILNRRGKMITQSSNDPKIADFIAYCIVSGIQMREALDAKGLHNIRIQMTDNNILLIIPSNSITFGLLLAEDTSIQNVFGHLRQALRK